MSRTSPTLVIDARPRGPSGPLAGERVLGRSMIEHLVDLAASVDAGEAPVAIHARNDEHAKLKTLLAARPSSRYRLTPGPPPEDAAILRVDRFYDESRLRRALRRGRDPESAVVWRIDRPHALAGVEDEIQRRREYQPLGRFWATAPAMALARALAPTAIHPNWITLLSASLMLAGAGMIALGHGLVIGQVLPALAFALALVLDTADGHLARLQGTASEFGRWLDANLDELGDLALHAAVAWWAYARSGQAGWLVIGMVYVMAKYLFVFGNTTWPSSASSREVALIATRPSLMRRLAHLIGHADIRWHAWIVLAAVGRLDLALVAYTAYFLARAAGGAIRKAGGHAA
jgi:phosphatidylglycerophosphate synthase